MVTHLWNTLRSLRCHNAYISKQLLIISYQLSSFRGFAFIKYGCQRRPNLNSCGQKPPTPALANWHRYLIAPLFAHKHTYKQLHIYIQENTHTHKKQTNTLTHKDLKNTNKHTHIYMKNVNKHTHIHNTHSYTPTQKAHCKQALATSFEHTFLNFCSVFLLFISLFFAFS